ncbi:MAG: FKBP-type peptidyl-prolyl cis-trans isomerase [Bacteroides sp.]|nr:FKBP-type peptidyl-prolyl cis-trans isomerase [Bacteroides sp.]MBD5348867.1 FKBP-type peptidyl-prolyl cis-trans isomerase [Bacteroides sp.]
MKKKFTQIVALLIPATMILTGCLKSNLDEYETWKDTNDAYLTTINQTEYQKIAPDWAPLNPVYIKWHNDRNLTASNLTPMSTSTVDVVYELEDINGTKIENTYSKADSVYTSTVNQNVVGMMIALTSMHVGDSVTLIVPYASGYGAQIRDSMLPYTNLIFHMKLKNIRSFEKPNS